VHFNSFYGLFLADFMTVGGLRCVLAHLTGYFWWFWMFDCFRCVVVCFEGYFWLFQVVLTDSGG